MYQYHLNVKENIQVPNSYFYPPILLLQLMYRNAMTAWNVIMVMHYDVISRKQNI